MLEELINYWPDTTLLIGLVGSTCASGHAVLYKRDSRALIGWVALIWFVPIGGALLYAALGVNRIARRAVSLRGSAAPSRGAGDEAAATGGDLPSELSHLAPLSLLVHSVTERPLLFGNRLTTLRDGDVAYPDMLEAIDGATRSVSLSTYIFAVDTVGSRFVEALARAVERGVEVRVLIDAVGARYSSPRAFGALDKSNIPNAAFLPTSLPWRLRFANLRNHRKLLVVDGRVGFTGGMNLRETHCLDTETTSPTSDVHFRVEGPVVRDLQAAFAIDWTFATDEALEGEAWFPQLELVGRTISRGVPDGPDEDYDKLRLTIHGAIASARSSIRIVTPYFLPDTPLITALNVAALRGVEVDIVLPGHGNWPMVDWATNAMLWQLIERGCRVWKTPDPFDHAKLMTVDDSWVLVGSANWDPRSLRLNFEFDLECYDEAWVPELSKLIDEKIDAARRVTLEELDQRGFWTRLRDGCSRLLSPYL